MQDFTKPPLGATPAYIPAENRIKELAEAIIRVSTEGRNHTGLISLWAEEIALQCQLMEKMRTAEICKVPVRYEKEK